MDPKLKAELKELEAKRPYHNQCNRFCVKCDAWKLHRRGRKYYTCLTCSLRTEKDKMPLTRTTGAGVTTVVGYGDSNQ